MDASPSFVTDESPALDVAIATSSPADTAEFDTDLDLDFDDDNFDDDAEASVETHSKNDSGIPTFAEMGLPAPIIKELASQGIHAPFPIQYTTIADALSGRDTLGRARTGSGKTLAFSLPLLTRLHESGHRPAKNAPRAVVLVPTRELANQVADVLAPLGRTVGLRTAVVYGGVGYGGQISALKNGVDIVVACPGRFVDLMESGHADLRDVEITVLDEADHMAELGFLEHVTQILNETPEDAQRLLFSATLDRGIDKVVRKYLHNPVTHEIEADDQDEIVMTHHFFEVSDSDRIPVITDLCAAPGKTLVFTRTKHGARKLTIALIKAGVPAVELHGDLSQAVRARNLAAYAAGKVDVLVATDIAARGIHVDDIALVIHADPPEEHKAFLHRSGRTARAGAEGTVVTMVTGNMKRHVKRLAKDAGIWPTTTRVTLGDDILTDVKPGERTSREMPNIEERRPQGKGGRNGGGQSRGNKRYGDRNDRGGRPSFRDRDDRAPREDRGDRPIFRDREDRAPREDRGDRDSRPSFRDRDDRAPRGDRDSRPSFRDRNDRAPRGDRDSRPSFRDRNDRGDRPSFRDRDDRAPRGDRDSRPSFRDRNDRAPRGDRDSRPSFRDRNDRAPRGERPAFNRDDRAPRGDRPDRGDRPAFSRDGRPGGPRSGAGRPASAGRYGKPGGTGGRKPARHR
jgi:superfamily II DNA/RNA helicase